MTTFVISALVAAAFLALLTRDGRDLDFGARQIALRHRPTHTPRPTPAAWRRLPRWPWHRAAARIPSPRIVLPRTTLPGFRPALP